jgi:hypothetical protein
MASQTLTQTAPQLSPRLGAQAGERLLAPWVLASAIAVPLALAYLLVAPPAADLSAATYRSELFARVGFALRDNGWYAAHGHYLPGYSLLAPALGAAVGVYAVLALSAVAACALFGLIAERAFGRAGCASARVAAACFAVGFCVGLLSGRMPYDLGLAIGLGAMLAFIDGRTKLAVGLAVVTSAASPVAGAFLALAGAAVALGGARWSKKEEGEGFARSGAGLALMLAALLPIVALALLFPEGGWEPFAPSSYWPGVAGVVLIAALLPQGSLSPRAHRTLRAGAVLYALALTGAFVIHTPVGGNAARLGALLAAPLLAGVLWNRQRLILLALAPLLLYWQLETPINDLREIAGEASLQASYYAPLRAELHRLTGRRPTIVEVPLTRSHWEAAYLAGHEGIELARGWERQLDTRYGALFYDGRLTAATYATWLRESRVAYVALPDARSDYAGQAESELVARGLPYLREVWRSAHWRLYEDRSSRLDPAEAVSDHALAAPAGRRARRRVTRAR